MKLEEFAKKMNMTVLTSGCNLENEVKGMYTGDLLSFVMSRAKAGNAWVTVISNLNTVAVALLTGVSCVILPENISADEQVINKARQEGIVFLGSSLTAYEICCKGKEIGIDDGQGAIV